MGLSINIFYQDIFTCPSSLFLAAPVKFLGGHHFTEDANKFDMLLLKLALNFRVSVISFSILTNVI